MDGHAQPKQNSDSDLQAQRVPDPRARGSDEKEDFGSGSVVRLGRLRSGALKQPETGAAFDRTGPRRPGPK